MAPIDPREPTWPLAGVMLIPAPHPLDLAADAERRTLRATPDIVRTAQRLEGLWQLELDRIYTELTRVLTARHAAWRDAEAATALREARRRWASYREARVHAIGLMLRRRPGTLCSIEAADAVKDRTRTQALKMAGFLLGSQPPPSRHMPPDGLRAPRRS